MAILRMAIPKEITLETLKSIAQACDPIATGWVKNPDNYSTEEETKELEMQERQRDALDTAVAAYRAMPIWQTLWGEKE